MTTQELIADVTEIIEAEFIPSESAPLPSVQVVAVRVIVNVQHGIEVVSVLHFMSDDTVQVKQFMSEKHAVAYVLGNWPKFNVLIEYTQRAAVSRRTK